MDREKVINELQAWIDDPYARDTAIDPTFVHDALALLKEQEKEIKALRLLVKWATDCDFDIDGMVHVAKRTLEDHGAFEEGR